MYGSLEHLDIIPAKRAVLFTDISEKCKLFLMFFLKVSQLAEKWNEFLKK